MKYVEVMQVPGSNVSVELPDEGTVLDAVEKAGFPHAGFNVAVTGNPSATLSTLVSDAARIILTREVKAA